MVVESRQSGRLYSQGLGDLGFVEERLSEFLLPTWYDMSRESMRVCMPLSQVEMDQSLPSSGRVLARPSTVLCRVTTGIRVSCTAPSYRLRPVDRKRVEDEGILSSPSMI